MEVDPDDGYTRVELTDGVEVIANTDLLLPGQITTILIPTPIPLLSGQLTDPCSQLVHAVVMTEPSRSPLIPTDRAIWITLEADVMTGFPERLQVLAIAVLHTIIEKIDHLFNVGEVAGKLGRFDTLVT